MNNSAFPLMPLALLPLFMLALWCFVCWLLSRLGGWHRLATQFPRQEPPSGQVFFMQRGGVGRVRYRGCLTIYRAKEGLDLSVFPLFRLGHPPLFLPWQAVRNRVEGQGFRGMGTVVVEVEAAGRMIKLTLPKTVFEAEPVRA